MTVTRTIGMLASRRLILLAEPTIQPMWSCDLCGRLTGFNGECVADVVVSVPVILFLKLPLCCRKTKEFQACTIVRI